MHLNRAFTFGRFFWKSHGLHMWIVNCNGSSQSQLHSVCIAAQHSTQTGYFRLQLGKVECLRPNRDFQKHFHPGNYQNASCSCPSYQRKFMCKHILGIAIRKKLYAVPPAAKHVAIGEKRKRGRPKNCSKALLRLLSGFIL